MSIMKGWIVVMLGIVAVLATGFAEEPLSGEVRIAGSSTVFPVSSAVAEEFVKRHPQVRIPVSSTGTGGGFANFFIPGKTDINGGSRMIKFSELKKCSEKGIYPIQLQVAIDALTVVSNKKADWAESMTFDQLAEIWGPDNPPQKWNEVNPKWPNEEFELYGAATTSGTFDYFTEVVMGEEDAHRQDYQPTEHDNVIVQGVKGSPYALGYFGYAYYKQNKNQLQAVAVDAGNGPVGPSLPNAQSGAYPLSRPLFIYVNRQSLKRPAVREFIKFYIRKSASDLVSEVGYVPVTQKIMEENLRKIEKAMLYID